MVSFLSTKPYKGTRDFYPEDFAIQKWMFDSMREVLATFGFEEYDGPMLESFDIYAAKTGEEIVNKQLYWLHDQGERKLAIRPEMTPTLARMVAGKLQELAKPIRWFSFPNLWRYERPQRGRLREHWQLNCDILGGETVHSDAEIIEVAYDLMQGAFKGAEQVEVKISHRGLVDHVFQKSLNLNGEQAQHVMKALDARDKIGEEAYAEWLGKIGIDTDQQTQVESFLKSDFDLVKKNYPCEAVDQLSQLFEILEWKGVMGSVVFDPTVMRGMDYYTATVFEIFDKSPENNRAMFGGGRYDNLIGLFGKEQLSGVGFGMGDVTLRNFLETHSLLPKLQSSVDVLVALPKEEFLKPCEKLVRKLRTARLGVITSLGPGKLAKQLKLADKRQARYVAILGDEEVKTGKVSLKNLGSGEQKLVSPEELIQIVGQGRS